MEIENVPHFALGQVRLGKGLAMIRAALASCVSSLRIMARRRPDIVISTGSGSQFFVLLWARLLGSKVVLVDSFARFHAPSKFARFAGPLAHLRITQSAASARKWPGSRTFDPLAIAPAQAQAKERLLFATVGATLPFPRLERAIVDLKRAGKIPERVVLQVGNSTQTHVPVEGLEIVAELPFDELQSLLARADLVVCHAGTGSILTALSHSCAVVAMPRSVQHGDHYDNHQEEIAGVFAGRGLIQTADDSASLVNALGRARQAPRHTARMDHQRLMAFLEEQFARWFPGGTGRAAAPATSGAAEPSRARLTNASRPSR